jgi:hypothetical protein
MDDSKLAPFDVHLYEADGAVNHAGDYSALRILIGSTATARRAGR